MSPTRLQRDGATLDAVRDAVREEFGPAARIVAAERVTTPGIAGLFRKAHVEATVEVPSPDELPTAVVAIADGPVQRAGIAALLADAEAAESRIAAADGTGATRADAFASVLDGFVADGIAPAIAVAPPSAPAVRSLPDQGGSRLQAVTDTLPGGASPLLDTPPVRVRPVPPQVRSADGDLVLLVGRAGDVDAVAGLFATRHALRPTSAADRRAAILARADGVRDGATVLAVAAWDDGATIEALGADQVWLVVDVGRKTEDAEAMLGAVGGRVTVAGVVAIGAAETATPESVHLLGVPVLSLG
ncbi:hypothetical protein [Curtobacterium sp. DN_7.5]|uniref:hypothetical protein n=1 Tax=Curtobacterium sp. DN_7.5 TaxID=3049047 RepID=UPI001F5A3832|nr:hypothetical protein [Curtobacterium sp. DN_7.5]